MRLREEKKQLTRNAILRTAEAAFRERGFEATRIRDIASALRLSEQTVFNYFPSKESLLNTLATSWYEALAVRAEGLRAEAQAGANGLADFLAGVRELLRAIAVDRAYMRLLFTRAPILRDGGRGDSRERILQAFERNRALLQRSFGELQQAGVLRDDIAPEEIAEYYVTLFNASVTRWLCSPGVSAEELEGHVLRALGVLFRGLRPDTREAA